MCGAACAGVVRLAWRARGACGMCGRLPGRRDPRRVRAAGARHGLSLQAGRLLGYSAGRRTGRCYRPCQSLAWMTTQAVALQVRSGRCFHLRAVLAWGLMLLVQARQPAWVDNDGPRRCGRVCSRWHTRPAACWPRARCGRFMPCGLLYSALLVAAAERRCGAGRAGHGAVRRWAAASRIVARALGLLLKAARSGPIALAPGLGHAHGRAGCWPVTAGWALWMDAFHRGGVVRDLAVRRCHSCRRSPARYFNVTRLQIVGTSTGASPVHGRSARAAHRPPPARRGSRRFGAVFA
jgi:hypothetical protein